MPKHVEPEQSGIFVAYSFQYLPMKWRFYKEWFISYKIFSIFNHNRRLSTVCCGQAVNLGQPRLTTFLSSWL